MEQADRNDYKELIEKLEVDQKSVISYSLIGEDEKREQL